MILKYYEKNSKIVENRLNHSNLLTTAYFTDKIPESSRYEYFKLFFKYEKCNVLFNTNYINEFIKFLDKRTKDKDENKYKLYMELIHQYIERNNILISQMNNLQVQN